MSFPSLSIIPISSSGMCRKDFSGVGRRNDAKLHQPRLALKLFVLLGVRLKKLNQTWKLSSVLCLVPTLLLWDSSLDVFAAVPR